MSKDTSQQWSTLRLPLALKRELEKERTNLEAFRDTAAPERIGKLPEGADASAIALWVIVARLLHKKRERSRRANASRRRRKKRAVAGCAIEEVAEP